MARTYPKDLSLPADTKLAQKVLTYREDVDINTCSKDVLVKSLGIPIVYANDIIALRESGYVFTYPEELTEIVGIPEPMVEKIASKLRFSYDIRQESFTSWRRANNLSVEELVSLGVELGVAQKLVEERTRSGSYRSIADITKRTGIPIERFRVLI
ncbi:MAG: helix-hairpin-helix domain-containing protein [Pseudanabaenaceae cyanobacterium]